MNPCCSIALQPGDEVVMVNGKLVEGMTSSEVVVIIKTITGDVNVVAKRGAVAVAVAPSAPMAASAVKASGSVAAVAGGGNAPAPGNGTFASTSFRFYIFTSIRQLTIF